MFEHKPLKNLEEYFIDLNTRRDKGIFFYRINSYTKELEKFLQHYYEEARLSGVIIEDKILNPDAKNLAYYDEIMGMDFQMSMRFIENSLKKWLPRMNDFQRSNLAGAIYDTLDIIQREGKNDNIIKNIYIKFMCWLYYKFERIVNQLGSEKVPKILYEGEIGNYELKIITILSKAGCDIVLLQYDGGKSYHKLDPDSKLSNVYSVSNPMSFPEEFSIRWIRQEIEKEVRVQRLYGTLPQIKNCTNAWISGSIFEDVLKSTQMRGTEEKIFYNCFCWISGVEDKNTYINELYQFKLHLESNKRRIVITNGIVLPSMEEIAVIKRRNYTNREQMILDLSNNIKLTSNIELQRLMIKNFIDVIIETSNQSDININKLTNVAVYLLCWLKRYQTELFSNWRMPEVSCFIYFGGCKNEAEAIFLKLLSRLPVDVLILTPDLNVQCSLQDTFLFEKHYDTSLIVEKFPNENGGIRIETAAYHAERELDTLMYQDSGMYRNHQYDKAVAVSLRTIYEEISILWDQEMKYRPNFSIVDSVVNMPVIFAKISGVKDGLIPQYWQSIRTLITIDTFVIRNAPFIKATDANPIKAYATEFLKNGKIQKSKIKNHKAYQYGFVREEIQDYILEKLQLLINQKYIKGTLENGTEYTVISTALNLNKDIIRLLQKFDFTKKNPKIVYINTTESIISLEDSIIIAFLNLIGFDIVFFIPTGYQNVERHFNKVIMEEHQIGEYLYDLNIPNFEKVSLNTRQSFREKILKRGH